MGIIFDHTTKLQPAVNAVFASSVPFVKSFSNPASETIFQVPFNPGHTGTSLMIEYDLNYQVAVHTSGTTMALVWQYKETTGSSWETLDSTNWTATVAGLSNHTVRQSGFTTASIVMPIFLRLNITATAATGLSSCVFGDSTLSYLVVRAIGQIE